MHTASAYCEVNSQIYELTSQHPETVCICKCQQSQICSLNMTHAFLQTTLVICASKFSLVKQAIWPMAQLQRSGMSRGNWDKLISTQMNCCLSCASFAGLACLLVHNAMQICRGSKFFHKVNCEARDFSLQRAHAIHALHRNLLLNTVKLYSCNARGDMHKV